MPREAEFPRDVAGLSRRNALELTDDHFYEDLRRLFGALDGIIAPERESSRARPGLGVGAPSSFLARLRLARQILFESAAKSEPGEMPHPASVPRTPPMPVVPAGAEAHRVFVSYSTDDLSLAEEVVHSLEGAGHRCWYAPRNIPPSTPSWPRAIVEAIARSRLMVVLVTRHSVASEQVLREVTIADSEKIPLLPFCVERVTLSPDFKYFFSAGQRLELAGRPTGQAIRELEASVAVRLAE